MKAASVVVGVGSLALLATALVTVVPPAAAATGTDVYGGVISADATWTLAGSPYRIHESVQVAENVTLRIDPGVKVEGAGASVLFVLAGDITIAGTANSPVEVDGRGAKALLTYVSRSLWDSVVDISIQHAYLHDANSLLLTSGYAINPRWTLTDSTIRNLPDFVYVWYPKGASLIARNVFIDSGGFSVGTDTGGTFTVENNRFQTASKTGYWVQSWQGQGEYSVQVHNNAFMAAGTPSVGLQAGFSSPGLSATSNYWGTTDPSVIRRMVLDGSTSIDRTGTIPYEPVLVSIPSAVPPAATFPPSAPRTVRGEPGDQQVTVSWAPPQDDGGSPVTDYTATSSPGGLTCTATTTTCTVTGLTNGTAYTFTVTARNSAGISPTSETSRAVTPTKRVTPPGAVTNLRAVPAKGQLRITWSPPVDTGADPVRYQVKTGKGRWVPVASTSTVVRGASGKLLTVLVRAANAAGPGPVATVTGTPK